MDQHNTVICIKHSPALRHGTAEVPQQPTGPPLLLWRTEGVSDNNVTMVIAAEDEHMHNVSCITNPVCPFLMIFKDLEHTLDNVHVPRRSQLSHCQIVYSDHFLSRPFPLRSTKHSNFISQALRDGPYMLSKRQSSSVACFLCCRYLCHYNT